MPAAPPMPLLGLSGVVPAFDRVTRLAKTLFSAVDSYIVLVDGGQVWRSGDRAGRLPQRAAAADYVLRKGELLWLEDAARDPRFDPGDFIVGKFRTGFYAAAPVRLADGSIPGMLTVFDKAPRPFDRELADRLTDLADSAAAECDLAQAVKRMERSEERLQLALELADIVVTDLDLEHGKLTEVGIFGTFRYRQATFEELANDPFMNVDPRDRAVVAQAWRRHVKEGAPYTPVYRCFREDGREFWAATMGRTFKNEAGQVTRLVAAEQNITDRKLAEFALTQAKEEAEAANRAKSTFLATMSHEIRTPLNGVLGMAQAMAMDTTDPTQRQRLEVIRQSGETLLAILNDVLDLSKIEAGKLELEAGRFDVAELAGSVRDVFAPAAEAKGCAFVLTIEPSAAGTYGGDPTRVRQVLYNLVSNALKFTEAGEIRVSVGAGAEGLTLRVQDRGIGMSPEHMAVLYQKFQQADASTTRRFGGTGLGLAISHELATLMGGTIRAESTLGEGSIFTVTLPLPRLSGVAAAPRVDEAQPSAGPAAAGPPLRVLAAEDNAVNQLVLKALLQHVDADLRLVDNGVDAVAAWEAGDWDVILMDVHMPQMDGLAATRLIRERERAGGRARTPIIALTADAMTDQVETYRAAGMDDFVPKPIEVSRLFAALEIALAPAEAPANRAAG